MSSHMPNYYVRAGLLFRTLSTLLICSALLGCHFYCSNDRRERCYKETSHPCVMS